MLKSESWVFWVSLIESHLDSLGARAVHRKFDADESLLPAAVHGVLGRVGCVGNAS